MKANGKHELLKLVEETTEIRIYIYTRQSSLRVGTCCFASKAFVGNEPFVVMLGDDIMADEVPLTKQLIEGYEKTHASNVAVMRVPHEETSKYGIIDPEAEAEEGLYNVRKFVEKPDPEDAPSDLAING